ncbi:folliculin-interacting protein 2-like isoform X2 [Branchiostoma floridae]|uniref:Folliculin-interacting protein 2-like isoform X2 n=1 Tax=Branchiostoma floridae TaxID=7739 RepID=A0A9J7KX17_BRAFL|nr:folliculin-interacting protein 2-like isoform X2 [Branchiostoma floridae]
MFYVLVKNRPMVGRVISRYHVTKSHMTGPKMALERLAKLLPHRKNAKNAPIKGRKTDQTEPSIAIADAPQSWKPPSFDKSQVRMLVFRDCEPQGKKLLFDSKAIRVVQDDETDSQCRVYGAGKFAQPVTRQSSKDGSTPQNSTGFKYQYLRPGSDVKLLGEMMFGSIALSYQGSTLKIHNIRVPPQLMLTKVFTVKPVKEASLEDSCDSHDLLTGPKTILNLSNRLSSGSASVAHSMPMAVPKSPGPENQREDDDSGIVASAASNNSMVTPFPSPSSSFSSTNSNSFHRRFMRSQATSMEYGLMRRCSGDFSGFSNTDDSMSSPPSSGCSRGRSPKIGVAVIISLPESDEESSRQFQKFFFSHFTLLETHMHKLRMGVERALRKTSQLFIQRCIEALDTFRDDVWHLYTAVRIQEPVWLNMMSYSKQRRHLVEHFLQELVVTMDHCNNKTTNYFLSTLLTAVLTHHLAWVPTVTPAGATPPSRTYLDKHSSKTLDMLAKTHPYNPLWAQLSDLYGAIGYPIKLARTVVTGRKAELVNRLLYLLSYFIRCSEVHENSEERDEVGENTAEKSEFRSCLVCGEESGAEYILVSKEEEGFTPAIDISCSAHDSEEPNGRLSDSTNRLTPQRRDSNESNNNSVVCRESPTDLQESRLENVSHVQRVSPRFERADALVDAAGSSMLTVGKDGGMVSPTRQLDEKEKYRYARMASKEGSISMLDEYFDGETEAKTIDDIQDELIRQSQEEERTAYDKRGESDRHSVAVQRTSQAGVSDLSRPVTLEGIDICEVESRGRALLTPNALSPVDEVPTPVMSCAGTPVAAPFASPVSGGTTPATPLSTSPRPSTTPSPVIPKEGQADCVPTQAFTDAMFEGSTDSTLTNASFTTSCESNQTARAGTQTPVQLDREDGVFSMKGEEEGGVSALPGDTDRKMSSCSSHGDQQEVLPDDLPMPRSKSVQNPPQRLESNFGRSLLAGYSEKYLPDFVLLGTGESDFRQQLQTDLQLATQTSVLDEPIAEAVCIVADTDRWTVQLYSSQKRGDKPAADVMGSAQVSSILQSVANLHRLKMPAEFCLMHLEDRLQELFFKSKMLAEYLRGHTRVTIQELSACVGIESSDLPLLTAVASTHSPHVAMSLV